MVRTSIIIRRINDLSGSLGSEAAPFSSEHHDDLTAALELLVKVYNERRDST